MPLAADVTTGPTPKKRGGQRQPAQAADTVRQHPLHDGTPTVPMDMSAPAPERHVQNEMMSAVRQPPADIMQHPLHDGTASVAMATSAPIGALPAHDNAAARFMSSGPVQATSLSDWIEGNREATNSSAPAPEGKPKGERKPQGRELTGFVNLDRVAELKQRIADLRATDKGAPPMVNSYGVRLSAAGGAAPSDEELAKADRLEEKLGRVQTPGDAPRAKQMTWEQYQALDPDQRAAVDFNTLLIKAREKDLNTDYQPSEEQRTAYHDKMVSIMGEGNGSRTFAPETLQLLDQINFEGHGEDFDSFLSLKNAINAHELKDFDVDRVNLLSQSDAAHEPAGKDYRHEAISGIGGSTDYAEAAAALNTADVERQMVKTNALLANLNRSFVIDRSDDMGVIGGTTLTDDKLVKPFGFGDPSMRSGDHANIDAAFNSWYASLANKANQDPEKWNALWGQINSTLDENDKGDREAFWKFLDLKTRQADEHGLDHPRAPGLKGHDLVDVDELRKKLGLGG